MTQLQTSGDVTKNLVKGSFLEDPLERQKHQKVFQISGKNDFRVGK